MRVDAETGEEGAKSRVTDYLRNEVAERMFERFEVGLKADRMSVRSISSPMFIRACIVPWGSYHRT